MKIAIVVPHIFMQDVLLSDVIFSPADLAIDLSERLCALGHEVTLCTPGPVECTVQNVTGDMSGFTEELVVRGYGFIELLKKHPLTFATLARQVQADLIAKVYDDANNGKYDIVHMYANEEDIGLQFAQFCTKPVVFTHHDPFNLTVGYKALFPRKKHLSYIAMSEAQKKAMPADTNWVATIPHGIPKDRFSAGDGSGGYVAYIGRIIHAKGVHHAINAVNEYNMHADTPIKLKIAGKYYQDSYFEEYVKPHLNEQIEFVGYIRSDEDKQVFLGNAIASMVPSTFEEPFGLTIIEALACGTPVIGLDSGAIPEVVEHTRTGFVAPKGTDADIARNMAGSLRDVYTISRKNCRVAFEQKFTAQRMASEHARVYEELTNTS